MARMYRPQESSKEYFAKNYLKLGFSNMCHQEYMTTLIIKQSMAV